LQINLYTKYFKFDFFNQTIVEMSQKMKHFHLWNITNLKIATGSAVFFFCEIFAYFESTRMMSCITFQDFNQSNDFAHFLALVKYIYLINAQSCSKSPFLFNFLE